jgi:nicotinate-nucleotide pyrophosphorylase (carboxylating)
MSIAALPDLMIEGQVKAALLEDLGRAGDVTTTAVIPTEIEAQVAYRARSEGCIAGIQPARLALRLIDPNLRIAIAKSDGDAVAAGDVIAMVEGSARSILTAERVSLNFLGHLSGIATATKMFVDAAKETSASICCTRKTTPGLRILEKHAVLAGGGSNHRFGLDDAILIKDNHIAMAGGIATALENAKSAAGHMIKIEIEVDTLDQLDEVLAIGVADAILLDNMSVADLREAITRTDGRAITEASGGVTVESAREIAMTGVDLISVGGITHSAPCLDIGLDFETAID